MIFYFYITGLLILPIVAIFFNIKMPSAEAWIVYSLLGFIEVISLFPFYTAFKKADTSIIRGLTSIGKILIPIGAYIFLGERLGFIQYLGYGLIIIASLALTFKKNTKYIFNTAIYFIIISSLIKIFSQIIEKYFLNINGTDWINMAFYVTLTSGLFSLFLLLKKSWRVEIKKDLVAFKENFNLFMLDHLICFTAISMNYFVLSHIGLVEKSALSSTSPIFVLLISIFVYLVTGKKANEDLSLFQVIKKFIFFIIIGLGIYLTLI